MSMSMQELTSRETSAEMITWQDICPVDHVVPGTGVAALVDGEQIAIIRTADGMVAALSNFDPFSEAYVISRGIVGDRAGVPKIASPIYKQSFDLRTGECLDDPRVRLRVYPVRVSVGKIQVALPARAP
ncbi:MAG TPA: nitrite reductase small subunit NirD [Polyangiaceae bacterium]|nr:nitrite reductase small subunit NirD [Polyangiaceae bacterium]